MARFRERRCCARLSWPGWALPAAARRLDHPKAQFRKTIVCSAGVGALGWALRLVSGPRPDDRERSPAFCSSSTGCAVARVRAVHLPCRGPSRDTYARAAWAMDRSVGHRGARRPGARPRPDARYPRPPGLRTAAASVAGVALHIVPGVAPLRLAVSAARAAARTGSSRVVLARSVATQARVSVARQGLWELRFLTCIYMCSI